MTQHSKMTYQEVRTALDEGKSLHIDNDGTVVGIVGEMDVTPPERDIRDAAGWRDEKAIFEGYMADGDYDLALEHAGEWLMISGDDAFWKPLVDLANQAWREYYTPEDLTPMRDDVSNDVMDYLKMPDDLDECF